MDRRLAGARHQRPGVLGRPQRFRFDSLFNGWILEQHENFSGSRDIYSNAIGIGTDRKLRIQRTGGEVSAHPSANGWQTTDTQTLVPGSGTR